MWRVTPSETKCRTGIQRCEVAFYGHYMVVCTVYMHTWMGADIIRGVAQMLAERPHYEGCD